MTRPEMIVNALRNYQQADEDGVMVLVSRQACDEAADEIDRLRKWNADMVAKSASGGVLDGYREMGAKLAAVEAERYALRQELDGVLKMIGDTPTKED